MSRSEWTRRQSEQCQLARDNIARITKMLESGNFDLWRYRKTIIVKGKEKLGDWLTDDEMRAYLETKLAEVREHLRVWSEPIDFVATKPAPVKIPKAVRVAMQRVRKRTRRMLAP